ncbi:DUF6069 family protein [Actinomycetospora sp. OC33-EN08]|uniref:DUF6069 family protein n=1 Tax=Actinomycetospora aurantiaca TaxID=3129233 RepID=A0ABU8MXB4_9PSEU
MSVTTATDATTTTTRPGLGSLLLHGAAATVVAAVATTAIAALGPVVGVSTDMAGQPIPATGFGFLTVIFCLVGLVIATALRRFARTPRTTWIRTTVGLTVLSLVPDVLADSTVSTIILLMLTHVVAAAVVIPAVARRLV